MIKTYDAKSYSEGGGTPAFKDDYDYLLFRQDYNMSESVYFNESEIDKVIEEIHDGVIIMHHNYSILWAKNENKLTKVVNEDGDCIFGCYASVQEKDNDG